VNCIVHAAAIACTANARAIANVCHAQIFTIDANRSLSFTLHKVYLALAKTPIEWPAEAEASYEFRVAFNATAQRMMTVELKNLQVAAEYG
jgi:hypothetical protein